MTHDEVVSFFAAQQYEWDRRDAEALTLRHADQGTIISPIFRTVHGRAEILGSYRTLFETFPDWHYVGQQLVIDGAHVAQEFVVDATHSGPFMGLPPSGRKFSIIGVRLFEMADGLIAHERRYYDFTGLLIQIGILRGKPAKA
ncbi:MAG: hypothetical protein V7647_3883 [Acidobacteriota bacterium]|jgi:steroid delta-isomerase-like uncharacterized protein